MEPTATAAMANLDVSLHAAEDLRQSLNKSTSRRRRANSTEGDTSDNYYDSSTHTTTGSRSFHSSTSAFSECGSLRGSLDSVRTWPRKTPSRKLKNYDNRFLKSSYDAGKGGGISCALHSHHSSGVDICPFDGSKYVLKPLTFSRPTYYNSGPRENKSQYYNQSSSKELSFSIPSFGSNCDENKHENNAKELKLNADLWPHVSPSFDNNADYSYEGKMSSCRYGDEYFTKSQSYFRPVGRNDLSSPSRSIVESRDGCKQASIDNSITTFRKELEAKYHSYREEYLTNSPAEELQTLNASILNVRKWLRRRNDTLKTIVNTDSNKVLTDSSVVQRLISDAKLQQEGVDVLLDRGQRFLTQRANIVLEVDLENLVFLWNCYVEDLRKFYKSFLKETRIAVTGSFESTSTTAEELHPFVKPSTNLSGANFKPDNNLSSCQGEGSSSSINELEEFNTLGSDHSKEKISLELVDENFQSSVSDINCVANSGDLTLADLATSDTPLDILDLSTTICGDKSSSNLEATLVSNDSNKNDQNDASQHLQNFNFDVTEIQAQASPTCESEKMEMEAAEESTTMDFDQRSISSSVGLLIDAPAMMNKDKESSSSPKGSSEGLVAIFDKPGLQAMDCIHLGSPTEPKRRRRLLDTPSSVSSISSRSGSPVSWKDSGSNTPTGSLTRGDRQNDLWNAIGNIDNFLLDKDLLEACKSTENDLTGTDEDCVGAPSVSFAEFLQQYKELIDWLNQMHKVVQREVNSLSEKYMNQAYHEEMLERSPRREFINTYSLQVLVRYPAMSDQISARMNRLNAQWTAVEDAIAPKHGKHDEDSMLQDLECDLGNLRRWLNAIESRLLPLTIHSDWTDSELEERLVQHQALQRDIESHNKVINAVIKLSDRLEKEGSGACGSDKDRDSLQLVALNLERRWHGIWLQSLEWQCRLEEAIGRRKGIYQSGFDFSGFSLPVQELDESLFSQCSEEISNHGLITLDDDSLLFIGGCRDYDDQTDSNGFDTELDDSSRNNNVYSSDTDTEFEYIPGKSDDDNGGVCEEIVKKEEVSNLKSQLYPPSQSKPDSPLGKRRITDASHCEGSPAKRGPSAILSSSEELSSESPYTSLAVSTENGLAWHPHGKLSSPIAIHDLKTLHVKRSLFDHRSSGDSANISEAESKMGDSPPSPFPDHHHPHHPHNNAAAVTNSDVEVDQPAVIKAEVKDIGYSSENQSNDEVETMRQQIAMEYRFRGKCELATDGPLGDKVLFPSVTTHSSYYKMTHVTDVDSTDKTDNGDTTDSSPEKIQDSSNVSSSICAAGENDKSSETDEFGHAIRDVYSQLDSISNDSQSSTQMNPALYNRKAVATSNSCSQTESPLNNLVPMHLIADFSESDSAPDSKGKKSVRYLIEHAEELVRPSTSPKRSRPISPLKVSCSTQSLVIPSPSKQTQTDSQSTVESSCDASGEDNSDNEGNKLVRGEMSTGTDDAEDRTLFDSVVNLGSATESANNISLEEMKLSSFHTSPVIDTPRLRKQTGLSSRRRSKKDRPWSVVGFQDPTTTSNSKKSDNCLPAVAASESAINNLHCHTDSDSCSTSHPNHHNHPAFPLLSNYSSTFPRTDADGRYGKRRTASLCAHTSYYNITTATQDLTTTTTSAIQNSISSFPCSQTFVSTATASDASSSGGVNHRSKRQNQKQRRTRRLNSSKSSVTNPEPDVVKYIATTTDSYDSADAGSESETTDDYLTACMEVCSSEADDVHNVSGGSLSEHSTWDNYQVYYPTGSEDPGEELLTWEPQDDLEFDDDFQISADKSIVKEAMNSKAKTKLKIKKHGAIGEDSDSDLEDFHDILNQSELQVKLAIQSLKKKRNDPMGTSLHPNPEKYGEILVTCDTNIKCLQTICQHLNTEDVTEADVKRVQDLMEQWYKVHTLASERHAQTTTLAGMREDMAKMNNNIKDANECLPFDRFSSADELKDTILKLKEKEDCLQKPAVAIDSVRARLLEFESQNPSICVDKYKQEMDRHAKGTSSMLDKVTHHMADLENNWSVWVEYLEGQQELDTWLAADRERLHGLLAQREFGSRITKKDVLTELETLQSNLSRYEEKLSVLQAMHGRLTHTSNDDAQRLLLASLADLRNQLFVVSERCRQVYKDAEDEDELAMEHCPDLSKLAIQASTFHDLMSSQADRSLESSKSSGFQSGMALPPSSVLAENPEGLPASKVCMSWLRSVPVQLVALVFAAGLVYALDPEILDRLTNFSLSITPELRYINGPPTV